MDLEESARQWLFANLPHDRSDAATVNALASKRTGELFVLYFNWADRLIPARPRRVLKSAALDQHREEIERSAVIDAIIAEVEDGRDLTKYLSRRVKIGFEPPPTR